MQPSFRQYAEDIRTNAYALAEALQTGGVDLVSGGTDTHLVLLDLSGYGITGQRLQDTLDAINITSIKNPVPFDVSRPTDWSGLRLGVAAATTRGLMASEMQELGGIIAGRGKDAVI